MCLYIDAHCKGLLAVVACFNEEKPEDFQDTSRSTPPETNIAPENQWLEDEFPFGMAHVQGRTVSFREGIHEVSTE